MIDETKFRLDKGEILEADIIISSTGFIRRFPFFTEQHGEMMGLITTSNQDVDFNLYRRIIPVGILNLGFIGFTASVGYWIVVDDNPRIKDVSAIDEDIEHLLLKVLG